MLALSRFYFGRQSRSGVVQNPPQHEGIHGTGLPALDTRLSTSLMDVH